MRQISLFAWLLACLVVFSSACNKSDGQRSSANVPTQAAPAAAPPDGVRRISVAELKAAMEKNEAIVVDVRGGVEYKLGHIRGARSIPLGLIAARVNELPRNKLIVSYCA
ncbi:MAG TPA: rhodanese-like domain-containing protein [Pyrinomonadaceae bacterium]|jgi:predicted sulfurtransferase